MCRRIKTIVFPWVWISLVILLGSCNDEEVNPSSQVLEINEFIWTNMNEMYLWNDLIPQNIDRNHEFDSEAYFEKLLNKPTDQWSFITDDYSGLVNSFKGIEKTFGHNFKLFLVPGTNDVMGIVKYVVPQSPADQAEMKRGDIFYKVNGITLNSSNYGELLFDKENYTLTFGEFNFEGVLAPIGEKSLTSLVLTENPILIHKTIDIEGTKIGYLSYNQFISDFSDSLISVFQQFKSDNITDLVLDLRYNPGGSITTAVLLSSMIAPSAVVQNNEIYSKLVWNDIVMKYILEKEGEESDNLISRFITPEVNLNLNRIYILVSKNSASASELVINCLDPYMEVILIGSENTTGKFVGSITVHDDKADHGWAMQPIVLKTANANGFTDFFDGFAPDYIIADDFNAELGTIEEDMLAKSIELITGIVVTEPARIGSSNLPKDLQSIAEPELRQKQNMYLDLD